MTTKERFKDATEEVQACLEEAGFSKLQALELMKQFIETISAKQIVEGLKDRDG